MSKTIVFSPEEISIFCDQIAMILNGGIPVYEGAYILYEEMDEGKTKDVLKKHLKKAAHFRSICVKWLELAR